MFTAHLSNLAESSVEVNDRGGLHFVGFQSLKKNFFLIIRSLYCCFGRSSKAALNADFSAYVEEKDSLGRADVLFKVHSLVEGSWKAINQIVLRVNFT